MYYLRDATIEFSDLDRVINTKGIGPTKRRPAMNAFFHKGLL